jgi:hypothetical protein
MTKLIVAFAILRMCPKTGIKSETKLIRKESFISGTVPEYPGRIFILLYENICTVLTKIVHTSKNKKWKRCETIRLCKFSVYKISGY